MVEVEHECCYGFGMDDRGIAEAQLGSSNDPMMIQQRCAEIRNKSESPKKTQENCFCHDGYGQYVETAMKVSKLI